jgi:hypothetical protein
MRKHAEALPLMAGSFLSMGKQINYARLQDAVGTKENYVCYRIPLGRK